MNNGKVCVSVCAETAAQMAAQIGRAEDLADVIELRFDCLKPSELTTSVGSIRSAKQLLCTFRPLREGGYASDDLERRLELWQRLASEPAFDRAYFDLESDIIDKVDIPRERKIASFHDFGGIPADIKERSARLSRSADIVKLAFQTGDAADALSAWRLLENIGPGKVRVIPIAMGDAGKWTRILGPSRGAFLTYASLESGKETAPGQISARDMTEIYRVKDIDRSTKVFGIIGSPIAQSLSPYMHNPAFAARGINAVFIPFLVENVEKFLNRIVRPEAGESGLSFGGLAVTMPHKQTIMPLLDEVDEVARKIGAVNTVSFEGSRLIGRNTDASGFLAPLVTHFGDVKHSRVGVFGAGGAARACIYALIEKGASVKLFARNPERARNLADDFGIAVNPIPKSGTAAAKTALADLDILIDATPFGMSGENESETLFLSDELQGLKFVYDLVTKAYDTPIVREAKQAGVPALGGVEMLVAQGVEQFKIWTGLDVPEMEMKENVLRRLGK